MSKITSIKIQERNKERCNIFIDGEFSFATSLEIVLKHGLKVDKEISSAQLSELLIEEEKSTALIKGIEYCCKYQKTKRQVKDYLVKKGYSLETAFYVIDKLKEYKYVDDVEYARKYLELYQQKEGKRLSFYKLMNKGVKKEDIENAFSQLEINSSENALNIAKKHVRNKELTRENLQKTYKYLLGKGFSYEEASTAISCLTEE